MSERVLIVLDSRAEASALAEVLSRRGHRTSCVSCGADAIREASGAAPPDIVVMDGALRDMDGIQALQAMKDRVHPGFLPVVLLSGDAGAQPRVAGLLGGADDVLSKPCQADELSARVAAMLRIKASQDELRAAKQEAERLSITDALTGLFNRRYFQYRLQQEVERTRRYGDPVSLMLLDLDHFKKVNDVYGHRAGDDALRGVAELLSRELRRLDVCTRWGGEEFAVIMPSTDAPGAAVAAERVLQAVRAKARFSASPLRRPMSRSESFRVTASLGVSTFAGTGGEGAEQLVEAADAALYCAKDQGRDRACFAPGADGARPAPEDLLRTACA